MIGFLLTALLAQAPEASIEGLTLSQLRSILQADESTDRDRCAAIALLGRLGAQAAAAVPELVRELRYERCDPTVTLTLGRIGAGAVPALVAALEDPNAVVSLSASMALDGIGAPAAGGLIRASTSPRYLVRVFVCWPLGGLASRDAQALSALLDLARDSMPGVRRHARAALQRLREPSADVVERLHTAAKDPDPNMATAAAEVLTRLSSKEPGRE